MLRISLHVATVWLVEALGLILLDRLIPGFDMDSWRTAFIGVAALGLLNAILRPILLYFTLPFTVLTFGMLSLVINALMLGLVGEILPGFRFDGVVTILLVVAGLAVINTVTSGLLSLNDESSFYHYIVARIIRRRGTTAHDTTPGLIIIEIDGLAEPMLRHAVAEGTMPHIERLIASGDHQLVRWDTGLPSQTSASQSGILMGSSFNIPAFRWYEKDRQRLMVSSRPAVAAEIERRLANDSGLLHPDGSSIGNLVSGGAVRSVLTLSALDTSVGQVPRQSRDFYLYFLNPYNFSRAFVFMIREFVVELLQGLRQRLRREWPRVGRGGSFPLLRTVSTVLLRDLTTYLLVEDILAGTPVVYATYFGYDVVAHHAGPFGPDTRGPLREIDRAIGRIQQSIRDAPRPYQIVLLSDHGQSQGATFRQRYGESLAGLVRRMLDGEAAVHADVSDSEGEEWGHINALLNELIRADRPAGRVARRALRRHITDDTVELHPREREEPPQEPVDIQVCASGNLGLIYFPKIRERLTLETIEATFPRLVAELAAHPGIGVVMVRSERHGPLAIGVDGIHHLANGTIDGCDPLESIGPHASRHLAALDEFPYCGDLVINSMVDPATGEVAAFEELVGSHGGLGGSQTAPFLLIPSGWDTGGDRAQIIGPAAVHHILRQGIPSRESKVTVST